MTKSRFRTVLFWSICFCFYHSPYVFAQGGGVILDKIVAKVDNQILLKSEFDMFFLQMIQAEKTFGKKVTPCVVLEQALTNKLLLAKAEIDSVVIDDKMVESTLDRRMDHFIAQIGSKEKLESYYGKTVNQLKSELRKQVKEQLTIQKMEETVSGKIKVSPGEVKKFYAKIPKDSLPFISKEFEIAHIVKYPGISRSEKYATKQRLEKLRNLIVEGGESFEKMASEYSEDVASARQGGELGYFGKGELVPEYEAAALKLKPGEISPVVESQFGFHIIKLIDRKGNEYNSKHILFRPNSSDSDIDQARMFLDSLRFKILRDSIPFAKAAKDNSDDRATKENGGLLTDRESNSTKISAEYLDPVVMFMLDTMKVGSISQPLPYRDAEGKEAYRLIYFKSVTQPHEANLKDDYQRIQFATLQEKKAKALSEWFNKTKSEVFIEIDDEYKNCVILQD